MLKVRQRFGQPRHNVPGLSWGHAPLVHAAHTRIAGTAFNLFARTRLRSDSKLVYAPRQNWLDVAWAAVLGNVKWVNTVELNDRKLD